MTEAELRDGLAAMLVLERTQPTDWRRVSVAAMDLLDRLNTEEPAPLVSGDVYSFLDDVDVREKDARAGYSDYAERQYGVVMRFLGEE